MADKKGAHFMNKRYQEAFDVIKLYKTSYFLTKMEYYSRFLPCTSFGGQRWPCCLLSMLAMQNYDGYVTSAYIMNKFSHFT